MTKWVLKAIPNGRPAWFIELYSQLERSTWTLSAFFQILEAGTCLLLNGVCPYMEIPPVHIGTLNGSLFVFHTWQWEFLTPTIPSVLPS